MFSEIKNIFKKQKKAKEYDLLKNYDLFNKLAKGKITPDMKGIELETTKLEIRALMDKSLKAEYEVAKEIRTIATKNEMSKPDLYKIVQLYNSTNKGRHSSWMYIKLAIQDLISKKNLRYLTLPSLNLEIVDEDWKLLKPARLQGVIGSPLIDRQRFLINLRGLGWGVNQHMLELNFKLYNHWADLEGTGYDEIVLKGIIVEERFEELVKMVEGIGLKFYLELHKEDQHVETASNLVGFN